MVKKEEFLFDSRDGQTKIHAVRWVPEGETLCILQIVHGMAEYIERYEAVGEYLAEKGILVTGEDHLGHGKSIRKTDTSGEGLCGYFCRQDPATVVVRDVHRLKKMTQEAYPGIPYVILGHSMGSFVFRNYLLRYGTGIQGAIISGTGMQPASIIKLSLFLTSVQKLIFGSKHVSKFIDKLAFGNYNQKISQPRTSFDWLCTQESVVDAYVADPLCGFTFTVNGFKTLFTLIDRLTKEENLKVMPAELPVLFIAGEQDPVGNYGEAVKEVCESFKRAGMQDVTLKLYPECRHEILNEKIKYEIYDEIMQWIVDKKVLNQ